MEYFGGAGVARTVVGFEVSAVGCQDAVYFPGEWAARRVAAVEAAGPIAVVAVEEDPIAGSAADIGEDTERQSTDLDLVEDNLVEVAGILEVVDSLADAGLDSLLGNLAGGGCQTGL